MNFNSVRKTYLVCLLVFLIQSSFSTFGQNVVRDLEHQLEIPRNDDITVAVYVDDNDVVEFETIGTTLITQSIQDPTSQIISEISSKKSLSKWTHSATIEGLYSVVIKNMSRVRSSHVVLKIKISKYKPLLDFPCKDSLSVAAKESVLMNGSVVLSKGKDKKFVFNVMKGDVFELYLAPLSKNTPSMSLINANGESLYTFVPKDSPIHLQLPVCTNGIYTLALNTNSLINNRDSIYVRLASPPKYFDCVVIPPVIVPEEVALVYDTIPMLILDTTIFLGALRDPINSTEGIIKINNNDTDVVQWAVLFGAGEQFYKRMEYYKKSLEGEAMNEGVSDLLSAYSLGLIKQLPNSNEPRVQFTLSQTIKSNLSKIRSNYAVIDGSPQRQSIEFKNTSESSGEKVYIYIVLLRKELQAK
jgi:hypothetical protein